MDFQKIPWFALGISLIVTTVIWYEILELDRQSDELEFKAETEKLTIKIQDSLQTHEQVLMGFVGLFSASIEVNSVEFSKFFNIQKIPERFFDIQGVGYIEHVSGEVEKMELEKKMNQYGLDFKIYPEGIRDNYYPVIFLEPQDFRNIRALGYDIYSEDIRKESVDLAVKTGQNTLTKKIILVQETEENIQNGFLMLLPVYDYNEKADNNLKPKGFVYSVFRINDFVEGVLGTEIFETIETKIYDGAINDENLFYDSTYIELKPREHIFSNSQEFEFGGRSWSLYFLGDIHEYESLQANRLIIPIIGYSMSFLLFYILILFSKYSTLTKIMIERERTSALGELSARISHDIRNPLSVIKNEIELLKLSNKIEKTHTKRMDNAVKRISHQIDEVLEFVRETPLQITRFNLSELVNQSIDTILIPSGVKIKMPKDNIFMLGDERKMGSVLVNLIFNAVQSIKEKGKIEIYLSETSTETMIEVIDSGPGIKISPIDKIFEPLVTSKQKGTGLGLASVKNIVTQHDGSISVKNDPTTFLIKIPIRGVDN